MSRSSPTYLLDEFVRRHMGPPDQPGWAGRREAGKRERSWGNRSTPARRVRLPGARVPQARVREARVSQARGVTRLSPVFEKDKGMKHKVADFPPHPPTGKGRSRGESVRLQMKSAESGLTRQ